ncbi:MAG: hypothetical protein JKX69_03895 [Rhodobacteraceae bacterium]|nr:hypothetical protein [Paracoccaceae bacterium]
MQGYHGLLRMTSLLLAEQVPPNGHVLVLGVGGGLEFKTFAEDHAGRQFAGVTRLPKYSASPKPILAQILNG